MPIIRVEMLAGRTIAQKKKLVEVISREVARIAEADAKAIIVILDEKSPENWGFGGNLLGAMDKRSTNDAQPGRKRPTQKGRSQATGT